MTLISCVAGHWPASVASMAPSVWAMTSVLLPSTHPCGHPSASATAGSATRAHSAASNVAQMSCSSIPGVLLDKGGMGSGGIVHLILAWPLSNMVTATIHKPWLGPTGKGRHHQGAGATANTAGSVSIDGGGVGKYRGGRVSAWEIGRALAGPLTQQVHDGSCPVEIFWGGWRGGVGERMEPEAKGSTRRNAILAGDSCSTLAAPSGRPESNPAPHAVANS
jgi:hypothetical protein